MRDYEELVELIRSFACNQYPNCSECEMILNGHECRSAIERRAADAIEELLAAVPKWISVEERLPEGNGTRYEYDLEESNLVLVYGINHIGEMAHGLGSYIYDHADPKDSGWNGYMDCDYDLGYCTVTHWMPLPEPPKEVRDA